MISIFDYPWAGNTPWDGSTVKEFPESNYPFIDYLSNENARGTSSKFFNETISLFFPPINKGPKLTFPISKNTFG